MRNRDRLHDLVLCRKSAPGRVARRNPAEHGRGALRLTSKVRLPEFPGCAQLPTEPCRGLKGARQPKKRRKAPAPHRALLRPVRYAATKEEKGKPCCGLNGAQQ
ncbi:hypothetical protein NDU88_012342 [Pleurodeles waltl]|uniref:Uncharacterized protein n=1 Tax=Pleurodeles waltl TaxID=8319 RepID=A0AAV7R5W3_PLEWA|nr:hypothetical protein NDU88_012342 [Pleurodeles waltl]